MPGRREVIAAVWAALLAGAALFVAGVDAQNVVEVRVQARPAARSRVAFRTGGLGREGRHLALRPRDRAAPDGNTFSRTRVTKLEDLARICPFHHYLKTFLGYTYKGGPGTWQWIPPENRDVDLVALRRVITGARRC